MPETLYKDTTYTVSLLVQSIGAGKIALPDIQRPFVWQATKVRELFDSMYRGFPVGYLLFWETGAEVGARQIGVGTAKAVPNHLVVDGQQRLTSIFAVITGAKVLRDDYTEARIRIAFRPTDATFAVTNAPIEQDAEYIPDISVLWKGGKRAAIKAYLRAIRARRDIDDAEENRLEEAIDRLHDLYNYPFKVIELSTAVDEEQVAEIFVRINSEGVTLVQSDFILTLMSVFWEKGRRDLEDFCRACRVPSSNRNSPFNWYFRPQPAQLLRATVAVAFRRGTLKQIYVLLRGKDLETSKLWPERRDAQFAQLAAAQAQVLNLTNWHEFLRCLERAGFRGKKMITSDSITIFCYVLWLIGRFDYGVSIVRLREIIARWFFMAHTTARFSTGFENKFDLDLARLSNLVEGDSDGFVAVLSRSIEEVFTNNYWESTLPNELASAAAKSPGLLAYVAALNILDSDVLLSTRKTRAQLDPSSTLRKGIELGHLFPRKYLQKQGVTDNKRINQIANKTLIYWGDKVVNPPQPLASYWLDEVAKKEISADTLQRQTRWHALPENWAALPYDTFLAERRKLMAKVVQTAFEWLADPTYSPIYPPPDMPATLPTRTRTHHSTKVIDLLDTGLLKMDDVLSNAIDDTIALVLADGHIEYDGDKYDAPSNAAIAAHGRGVVNGWAYWSVDTSGGLRTLASLRDELLKAEDGEDG